MNCILDFFSGTVQAQPGQPLAKMASPMAALPETPPAVPKETTRSLTAGGEEEGGAMRGDGRVVRRDWARGM